MKSAKEFLFFLLLFCASSSPVLAASPTAPTVQVSASPEYIKAGTISTLSWTTTNVLSVSIEPGLGDFPPNGSIEISPQETTTYLITATGGKKNITAEATVYIVPPPRITFYSIPGIIRPGDQVTLVWSAPGASSCSVSPDIGSVGLSGYLSVSPLTTTTYTLTASGIGGTSTADLTVLVKPEQGLHPPTQVTRGEISATLMNQKQLVRSSSGQLYYFNSDRARGTNPNGWIEVTTSPDGATWTHYHHDEWSSGTGLGAAIDSKEFIHLITYGWNLQPYYQKFHTIDSASGQQHTWEAKSIIDSRAGSSHSKCAITIDANDNPHILYQITERLKGKTYDTLYYANYIDGEWQRTNIIAVENAQNNDFFDVAVGPDNIPYLLLEGSVLKGNQNNPSSFDEFFTGGKNYSFAIHTNGDVRVALQHSGTFAHYLHDASQDWNDGWSLLDSGKSYGYGALALVDDIPYSVFELFDGVAVQKGFEDPVLVSEVNSAFIGSNDTAGRTPTTRWSFYNHHFPRIIDLGMRSYLTTGTYYWYSGYFLELFAGFSADATKGLAPLTVNFTDNSSTTTGHEIVAWAWDFDGDGIIDSSAQNPSFTFGNVGLYSVSLTVTDSAGGTKTTTKTDYILVDSDSDSDTVNDSEDNCPGQYNLTQVDLDGDGIGYVCDDTINIIDQSYQVLALQNETRSESNSTNVSTLLGDTNLDQAIKVQHLGKFDVVSFQSDINPPSITTLELNLYISALDGDSQVGRIYAYNADGVSVDADHYVDSILTLGWNSIDLSALLPFMENQGMVKVRLVVLNSWIDLAEASMGAESAIGVDNIEIAADPASINFGAVPLDGYVWQDITISQPASSWGIVEIGTVKLQGGFAIIDDQCSNTQLFPLSTKSCTISIGFCPQEAQEYSAILEIESNDRDHPVITVPITGSGEAVTSSTLQGVVSDGITNQPIPDVGIRIIQERVRDLAPGDMQYGPDEWTPSDYDLVTTDDGQKVVSPPHLTKETALSFDVRNPHTNNDPFKISWNGFGGLLSDKILAQGFQPSHSGKLDMVRLKLGRESNINAGVVKVFISNELGGNKDSLLGESEEFQAVDIDPQGQWMDFHFLHPVQLEPGQTYFIILSSTSNYIITYYSYPRNTSWHGDSGNPYKNGDGFHRNNLSWQNSDLDFMFETYMDGQLDQQSAPEGRLGENATVFSGHFIKMMLLNRSAGRWEDVASAGYAPGYPGYDDETLGFEQTEKLNQYYNENGWISVQILYRHTVEGGSILTATDSFEVDFRKTNIGLSQADGSYAISGLSFGDFSSIYKGAGYYPLTLTGSIGLGETKNLDAQLDPAPPLQIAITSPNDGFLSTNASIAVEGSVTNNAVVTINGKAAVVSNNSFSGSFSPLHTGENIITATATDEFGQVATESITVIGNWGAVEGIVTDVLSGQPLQNVSVSVYNNGQVQTDSAGFYQLLSVPTGEISVSARKQGYETVTFSDQLSLGQTLTANFALPIKAPVVTDVFINYITKDSARITWYTGDVFADSFVEYGKTTAYGNVVAGEPASKANVITLTGLDPQTTYHLKITATEIISGSISSSSSDYTFRTKDHVLISNIHVADLTGHSATINWTTDIPTDSFVEFGQTAAYGDVAHSASSGATNHSVTLLGLNELATYHYRITATDSTSGGTSSSDDRTFTTKQNVLISNISVSSVSGRSATINWTTDIPSTSQVDYGETSTYGLVTADTTLTLNHGVVLDNLLSGQTYHFKISSQNSGGFGSASSDRTFATDLVMQIDITSPSDRAVIDRPEVIVQGLVTVFSGEDFGITVNGRPVPVYNQQFAASDVPLVPGANPVVVQVTTENGDIARKAITVTHTPVDSDWLELSLTPESGVADPDADEPRQFQTTLRAEPHLASEPMNATWGLQYTYTGNGISPEAMTTNSSTADGLTHQLTFFDPGLYTLNYTLTDTDSGQNYTGTTIVTVLDAGELDTLLKNKWEGMKSKLAVQNIEGGVSYFLKSSQENYRGVFNGIADLPGKISQMQDIQMIYVQGNRTKYRIIRDQKIGSIITPITYYIYFVRDWNGLWKIDQF